MMNKSGSNMAAFLARRFRFDRNLFFPIATDLFSSPLSLVTFASSIRLDATTRTTTMELIGPL